MLENCNIIVRINKRGKEKRKMKRNLSSSAVALLLVSVMLLSSLTFTSNLIYAQGDNITFTTGTTMSFTSNTEMTITSDVSMRFGTGIQMQFIDFDGDGVLEPCDYIMVNPAIGYLPPSCSWWEVLDLQGNPTGYEFHVDGVIPPYEAHVDYTIFNGQPAPIPVPQGIIVAEKKIETIKPCDTFVVHWPSEWYPLPCSWWEILDPYEGMPTGYEFHVDATNESCEFHIDEVTPGSLIFAPPYYYELEARQKIIEIKPCDWFVVTDPQGFTPPLCSWWEILDPSGLPSGLEFHVDGTPGGPGKFHVDDVIPSPLKLPWGASYSLRVRQKIDIIQECFNGKTDPIFIPDPLSWWKVINPSIGDVEFRVDSSNPDGTFHVATSTQVAPFTPPVYIVTAEKKISDIQPCYWFTVGMGDPLPGKCSWWRIISPQQWAGIIIHVDSNDGISRFHVDQVQGQITPMTPPPYSVTAEPYTPQGPSWYIKNPYPDYAPSGMPDFDERQADWWWRSWAFPDAVAVWQHFDDQYNDWDIYYSIYTDPNIWWTIGTDYARPIVSDSPMGTPFLGGDDKQPAISWYSSNYAICVWQHWMGNDWDIFYSVFTPNIGWSIPAPISVISGYDDYDPAIAFDTNGYAVCVWVHGTSPNAKIYYSVWNPNTLSWVGPNSSLTVGGWQGKAAMPEIDIDSNHKVVTIWTDTAGGAGTEKVWFSWTTLTPPIPPNPVWNNPAAVPACPVGMNWQKGLSPNTLGNNLMDWGLPAPSAGQEPLYYAKFNPGVGWNPVATPFTLPTPTNGEHPDLAYDFNNNAIAVYTQWPTGQIWYSFWNGGNWQPVGGAFAATAGFGAARADQWPALAFIKNNKGILVWNSYPEPYGTGWRSEIYYSVYTPTYPTDSWTQAKKIYEPNNPALFLTGDDYYVDIASPTGSATTPMSVPPNPAPPANPYWTWCGPLAVANSIWWFDSKYESNTLPPPTTIIDTYPLVTSYNPGVWDDHDPRNVQPFVEHLAYLMDCDGMRTKLCHDGSTVWDMQAGITHYLSWSGVNPLGDVDGNGIVDQNDVSLVAAAMGSKPGTTNWNLAADIYPVTTAYPPTTDNIITLNDLALVSAHMGERGQFYEHTTGLYPSFSYIEEEVMRCQDVVLLLAFFQNGDRDGGHFVTVAGVNSTASQYQLLISNPIRDDFESGATPAGRSPVPHVHGPEPPYTTHNNASLVSQDAWTVKYNAVGGYWYLEGYFSDSSWEARIEFAVTTSPYIRDVAVVDVKPWKTVVGQGYTVKINVTVTNEGEVTETFTLTAYADLALPEGDEITIGTQIVSNLLVGETRTITFVWDTTGVSKGSYTISAVADTLLGETHPADNTFTDGLVKVVVPGDINGDGTVDGMDLGELGMSWLASEGGPDYVANRDINGDGTVDGMDLGIMGMHWLETDP